MKNWELDYVKELIDKHLKTELFHIKEMNKADDFIAEIRDPHDDMIRIWKDHNERHRQKMVIERRFVKELVSLIGGSVEFSRPLNNLMVVNPMEVKFR